MKVYIKKNSIIIIKESKEQEGKGELHTSVIATGQKIINIHVNLC